MCMIISGLNTVFIFPGMIEHIFSGYRGTESIDNFKNASIWEYGDSIKKYFEIFNYQIFGKKFLIIFLCLLLGYFFYKWLEKGTWRVKIIKDINFKYILLAIPSLLYFLLIAKISVYKVDRYMFPIYGIIIIAFFSCLFNIIKKYIVENKELYISLIICCIIMSIGTIKENKWSYLYLDYPIFQEKIEEYSELDALVIYDQNFKTKSMFQELLNYKSVTYLSKKI